MASKKANPWLAAWHKANPGKTLPASSPWKPWKPDPPPPGFYDPSLDAQRGQINRGYGDTLADAAISTGRRGEDRATAEAGVRDQFARGYHDLETGWGRTRDDIANARQWGQEDYGRATQTLQRTFERLAGQQSQQARAYGVSRGGASIQAARKRAENQRFEQQGIDTGWNRQQADLTRAMERGQQDYTETRGRLDQDQRLGLEAVARGDERAGQDLDLGVFRAGRETTQSGLDIDALKRFQAVGAGWTPSQAPSNEFMGPQGAYRTITRGRTVQTVNPAGYVTGSRRRRR